MRGNPPASRGIWTRPRSIPAYAGEPSASQASCWIPTVYPRVCGGTGQPVGHRIGIVGLSPRMRGNLSSMADISVNAGSIPAYAGEPPLDGQVGDVGKVYPRVCGGTFDIDIPGGFRGGLSPRMRGNPIHRAKHRRTYRSIPAYAGEPKAQTMPSIHFAVYPRVCGGTSRHCHHAINDCGLSPRMRGNPGHCRRSESAGRSIPAYAGEPMTF